MTITIENIEESKLRAQEATNWLTSFLHQNIVPTPSDSKESIERKIDTLSSLKEYFLKNIDTDKFSDNKELIKYMLFIESITLQIQKYEIIIGRKDIETLHHIGQRLGRKQRISMGIID